MSVLVPAKHYGRNFQFCSKIMRYFWTQLGNICHCLSVANCHYTESLRKQLFEKSEKNGEVCLHFLVKQQLAS